MTIIVLLILAGISITMLIGTNGILNRATEVKEKNEYAKVKETIDLAFTEAVIDKHLGDSTETLETQVISKLHEVGYITGTESTGTIQKINLIILA